MSLDRPLAPNPYDLLPPVPDFRVTSSDVVDGRPLDEAHVFDGWGMPGGNRSPQLTWAGFPPGTAGFAVTCFDPDAPTGSGWWHWLLLDLPADVTSLEQNAGAADAALPGQAFHVRNDYGMHCYGGAAPPQGDRPHRYFFAVHALSVATLGIDSSVSAAVAGFNLTMNTVARGYVVPVYAF
jgi:Raf kinase inhibitor-like YbhB/YbcL family protein